MAQTSNTSRDFTFSLHLLLKTALDAIGDRPWLQTELLANTCIEERVFEKESPLGVGGDFHILRSKPSDLLKYVDSTLKPSMIHRFTLLQCNTVVLRTPKSNLDQQIAGGQRILDSLATEIQILKDERLKSHPNIVNLTGICWEFGGSLRQLAMPVMVLETAEAGDLSTYTQRTSKLGARDRLRLAIHCFEGLRAVHNAGVIHADIKPENVLIFTDTDSRPHAKLADFGCSVLLNEVDALIRLESGTPLWQSPRVSDALNAQQLRATDTYSLTLVTSLLLIGYPMYAVLEEVAKSGDDGKSLDELKAEEGALAALILRMQREANELQGTCFDKDVTALIAMFFRVEVSLDEEIAIGGTDLPLRLLRVMLHREIVIAVTRDARTHDTLDELEKDVYLCPDIFGIGLGEVDEIARWYTAATDINQQADPESPVPLLHHPHAAVSRDHINRRKNTKFLFQNAITSVSPSTAYLTRPPLAESIISFNQYFSRLRRLPARVSADFHVSLRQMANSDQLDKTLRGLASYEMAAFIIGSHRIAPIEDQSLQDESLQDAGKYLLQAAKIGHAAARIHVGTILDWIGIPNPIDKDIEADWCYMPAVAGNLIASSRLKLLSPARHIEATQERVGLVASNILSSLVISCASSDQEFSESAFLQGSQELMFFIPDICLYLVCKSWHLSLKVVLRLPGVDVDMDLGTHSSLLLCACQKGDYVIARLLIEHSATPKASSDGLTPLHCLHRFPDDQILPMAKLLKDSGADLEARCELQIQRAIGQTDLSDTLLSATALLFAVAKRNLPAVSALISLGADPFSGAKPYEKYDSGMPAKQSGRIYSPVHYAARLHLSDILQAILPENKKYEQLYDWMCYETETLKVTPLWCAVDYWYQGLWNRVLFHGKDHVTQCKKTIDILLNRGAQGHVVCWDTTTHARQSVYEAACLFGQPFVLSHLHTLEMEPTTKNLIMTLQHALEVEDSKAIDYLLPIAEKETSSSERKYELKASIQGHKTSDYLEYLYCIKERLEANSESNLRLELVRDEKLAEVVGPDDDQDILQQKTSSGGFKMTFTLRPGPGGHMVMEPESEPSTMPPKGTPLSPNKNESQMSAFELAVLGGYEERARELFEKEQCDTLCRRTDENGQTTTLIGRLIQKSRRYSAADNQVLFLLKLTPPSHEEFFDAVVESDPPTGQCLTILHLASVVPEWALTYTPRAPRAIISEILNKYSRPDQLNAMTGSGSESVAALHLAVNSGSLDALKELEFEALDWNIVNGSGCTPMDVAGLRQQNVHNFLQNTRKLSRDENPASYRDSVNEYRSNVVRMQKLLVNKGGRHKKYGGFMYRRSEDMWELTEFQSFVCQELPVMEHLQFIEKNQADWKSPARKAYVEKLRSWSRLEVDESMLCPLLSQPSSSADEAGSSVARDETSTLC